MNVEKYLIEEIKKCKLKMNIAKLIDYGVLSAAVGGILGVFCELFSLIRPFFYVHLTAGLCFAAGFLTGIFLTIYKRTDMKQAAGKLDSFGLKERMITAYEQMDSENEFAQMQRQDAFFHYNQVRGRIKISFMPDLRHILALIVSIMAVIGLSFVPSPVREQAAVHHQVREQAMEEQEKLEELIDALERVDMDSLTEDQKTQLRELVESMKLSREELAKSASLESLKAAGEKLNYKYDQAKRSLESLAAQMENPDAAGIAAAEALAKAAANRNGEEMADSGTPNVSSGDGNSEDADGKDGGSGENKGSGDGQGNGGDSQGGGKGEGDGDGIGQGDGDGNGSGQGDGNGNGSGSSNSGNGTGSGRGTGSSDASHDYVSIPNSIADDSSLTGEKGGNQNSDYFRQQNGLAWEGAHVDYSSVIGEYTDSAYEGIANGRYPSGMEPVIRDYFENLNK